MTILRNQIIQMLTNIHPFDKLEADQITDAVNWARMSDEIFRIEKPDKPGKHLVCYFLLLDSEAGKLWLGAHRKSGLWLPAGGHPERNEHPRLAVIRELREELGQEASFITTEPIFLTQALTVGATPHTDVTLWFLLSGDSKQAVNKDGTDFEREYTSYQWLSFSEILAIPIAKLDPHMHRLVHKLQQMYDANILAAA